jgi:hypothetical protein
MVLRHERVYRTTVNIVLSPPEESKTKITGDVVVDEFFVATNKLHGICLIDLMNGGISIPTAAEISI